jgi:hypothetical protein
VRSPLTPFSQRMAIALFIANVFALKSDRLSRSRAIVLFGISQKVRSPFIIPSQPRAILATHSILLPSQIHPFAMYTAMLPVILIHNLLKDYPTF